MCLWILAQVISTSLLTTLKNGNIIQLLETCLPFTEVSFRVLLPPGLGVFSLPLRALIREGISIKHLPGEVPEPYLHLFQPPVSKSGLCQPHLDAAGVTHVGQITVGPPQVTEKAGAPTSPGLSSLEGPEMLV